MHRCAARVRAKAQRSQGARPERHCSSQLPSRRLLGNRSKVGLVRSAHVNHLGFEAHLPLNRCLALFKPCNDGIYVIAGALGFSLGRPAASTQQGSQEGGAAQQAQADGKGLGGQSGKPQVVPQSNMAELSQQPAESRGPPAPERPPPIGSATNNLTLLQACAKYEPSAFLDSIPSWPLQIYAYDMASMM